MRNRNGKSQRYWTQKYFGDGYNISYSGLTTILPDRNWLNQLMDSMQLTSFMNDTSPNQVPYPNRTLRDLGLKEGLISQIWIRW
jgi:hypothetical protein